jgi:hypothetical protein
VAPPALLAAGDVAQLHGVWWLHAPQWGRQKLPPPQPLAATTTQFQPGGHWLDAVQVGRPAQKTFSQQKQQPSVVIPQPHALHTGPQALRTMFCEQPPRLMQLVEAGALAPAVDAVSIDPAPSAAAPTPARLSRRPLVTRVSDTAMQRPPELDDASIGRLQY